MNMRLNCWRCAATVLTILLATSHLHAQSDANARAEKLDEYFKLLVKNNKFIGTVAVAKDGEVIFHKQYGIVSETERRPDENYL